MMCCLLATSPKKWSQTSRIPKKMHQQVDLKRNHNRWSLTVPYHIQRCLEKWMRGPSFGSCKRILWSCHMGTWEWKILTLWLWENICDTKKGDFSMANCKIIRYHQAGSSPKTPREAQKLGPWQRCQLQCGGVHQKSFVRDPGTWRPNRFWKWDLPKIQWLTLW